nr:serine/arginine repetitive matrix protein 1 isoform X8 [Oryctolagus cuniculus]XP_051675463.1 serine/arginine repetitive matrix protein 1 isoform X8 [Oryctolagus cuniculus]XP_051675464.1 serine/arginine repetitive matrix protein 1 isoform X8 [Oryctolagus cuniculus]XP_051675465.1 serine/arginine repetitive matrix protein 1 isoform X8 [Oryctolagus cuniculus]XP_051675466.1 serine/arginine repetitive matrix protein 1 isoform X8 [Oryctolagus cuniculus]XP_051675467.1 serine/arginine repetitive mat
MARKGGVGSPPHGPPSLLLLRGLASSSGRSTRALRSPSPQRQGRAKYSRRRGEGMEKQRSTGREASSCETIRTGGRSCRGGGEGVRGGGVRRGRGRRALEPSCSCQQARRGSAERARPAPASLRRRRGRAPRRPRSADEPARLGDGETREGAPGLERSLSAVPRPPPPAPAPPPAAPSACPTPPSRSPLLAGPTPPSSDSKPRPFAALPPSPGSTDGETSGLLRLGPSAKASAPATDVNRKKAKNFATQPHLPSSSEKLPAGLYSPTASGASPDLKTAKLPSPRRFPNFCTVSSAQNVEARGVNTLHLRTGEATLPACCVHPVVESKGNFW